MRISSVESILFTARWSDDPTFPDAPHSGAFVRIRTDDGLEGVGEPLLGYFIAEAVVPLVDFFRPVLLGRDPANIRELWSDMYASAIFWSRSGAGLSVIGGLEMALWDLKGKALGVPVYDLFGGAARQRVPVYASGGPSVWPPQRTVEKVLFYKEHGYRAAKVSTGYYFQVDTSQAEGQRRLSQKHIDLVDIASTEADKLARLRAAVGSEFDLAIDGHQGGVADPISANTAFQICAAIEDAGLLLYEEPLAYEDIPGYVALRRKTRVPIAGGESVSGVDGFERFLEADALDIVQPDLGWVGGLQVAQSIITRAAARGLRTAIHTGGSVGPGLAASLHLAVANPNVMVLEHTFASSSVQALFFKEQPRLVDGALMAPELPGLGIELRDDVLRAHTYRPGSGERT
jgi:L-alanine-DL-glutamate epimerase-like enolase superfamily enzyme